MSWLITSPIISTMCVYCNILRIHEDFILRILSCLTDELWIAVKHVNIYKVIKKKKKRDGTTNKL